MKIIQYGKTDFPTGFDAELLRQNLVTNHGKNFNLSTTDDFITLIIDEIVDNEVAARATCTVHFAKTLAQRVDDLANLQSDTFFFNGDKQKRFLLDLLYRMDQRVRILEAAPAITKVQFFNGIKNIYKAI